MLTAVSYLTKGLRREKKKNSTQNTNVSESLDDSEPVIPCNPRPTAGPSTLIQTPPAAFTFESESQCLLDDPPLLFSSRLSSTLNAGPSTLIQTPTSPFTLNTEPQYDQCRLDDPPLLFASRLSSTLDADSSAVIRHLSPLTATALLQELPAAAGSSPSAEESPLTPLREELELDADNDYASSGYPSVVWRNGWRTVLPCKMKKDGSFLLFGVSVLSYFNRNTCLRGIEG